MIHFPIDIKGALTISESDSESDTFIKLVRISAKENFAFAQSKWALTSTNDFGHNSSSTHSPISVEKTFSLPMENAIFVVLTL